MRTIAAAVVICLAWSAEASWFPTFSPMYVRLRPGESTTLTAHIIWSGLMPVPFSPMRFEAEDPAVAIVDGYLPTTAPGAVRITALGFGVTRIRLASDSPGLLPAAPIIAVADRDLNVNIAVEGALVAGGNITLRASCDDPQAVFTWYDGTPTDSWMWQMASGAEFSFVPRTPLVYQYWVLATSPSSAGIATIALDIRPPSPRQRAARH